MPKQEQDFRHGRPLSKKEALSPYRDGLHPQFKRVAKRGSTWDLPRSFKGYQASDNHTMSMAGAATKCFLSRDQDLDGAYIAKFAHKNAEIETYTELFNNQLGKRLGFNMAHSGVARLDGVLHFLSRSFRTTNNPQMLMHGSALLEENGLADQFELEVLKTTARQQDVYDIDLVKSVIYNVCGRDADMVFASLVEMLVFDALIGSMDRHPRNWGVLKSITIPVRYELSPVYDSARALLWDRTNENLKRLETNEQEFSRYVQKSFPRIGLPKRSGHIGKCTHVDLIRHLVAEHNEIAVSGLVKIRVDMTKVSSELLHQFPFRRVFSGCRARLIIRLLNIRQAALERLTL